MAASEKLLPLRKNDLHRKEAVLALGGQSTFIFLDDAVRHFDGVVGGAGVSGLRRTVGADDVHHHEALAGADQQVDAAALRLGHLHGALDGVVEHIGKEGVEVAGLKKAQTAAVRHRIELDAAGFAEQRFFGEHHVQHLVAGVAAGVVELCRLLGLVDVGLQLRVGRVGRRARHLAEGGDLKLQLMAALVDDLDVLPRHLILLPLALI